MLSKHAAVTHELEADLKGCCTAPQRRWCSARAWQNLPPRLCQRRRLGAALPAQPHCPAMLQRCQGLQPLQAAGSWPTPGTAAAGDLRPAGLAKSGVLPSCVEQEPELWGGWGMGGKAEMEPGWGGASR